MSGWPGPPEPPAPGWYRDPWYPGALRWWDGTGWTQHAVMQPAPPPLPYQTPAIQVGSYAGWWRRLGGYVIDALVLGVPILAVVLALHSSFFQVTTTNSVTTVHLVHRGELVAVGGVGLVINWAYNSLLIGWRGQTVGMMAAGTRVADAAGHPVGYGRAGLRTGTAIALGPIWSLAEQIVEYARHSTTADAATALLGLVALVGLLLNYLWPLGSPRKQALHDKAIAAVVVRTR